VGTGYQQAGREWRKPVVITLLDETFFLLHVKLISGLEVIGQKPFEEYLNQAQTQLKGVSVATSKDPFSGTGHRSLSL